MRVDGVDGRRPDVGFHRRREQHRVPGAKVREPARLDASSHDRKSLHGQAEHES
jgi:hypothetical protein